MGPGVALASPVGWSYLNRVAGAVAGPRRGFRSV